MVLSPEVFQLIVVPALMGLGTSLIPGPLMTALLSETLKHNLRQGIKISLSPIISDAPPIILSLVFVGALAKDSFLLGLISIAGSFYLVYIGISMLRVEFKGFGNSEPMSLIKILLVNLTSPHVWGFWFLTGSILALQASSTWQGLVVFVISFYVPTILVNSTIATLVSKGKNYINKGGWRSVMIKILAIVMLGLAVKLLVDALSILL